MFVSYYILHILQLTLEFLVGIIIIIRSIVDFDMIQDIHIKFGNQMTKNLVIVIIVCSFQSKSSFKYKL